MRLEAEKDQGLLKIYMFTYREEGELRRGQAIFVKSLVLPLYRLHGVSKGGYQDFKYITAVKDFKEINIVEISGANIKIIETENVLKKNILSYLLFFAVYEAVLILRIKYRKQKDKANQELEE